ncbi:MAG: EpsI family protein [Betaproteobacteria bacterium]|nr:EpsI family protein [Betaproteobacteria bacterium]
MGTIEGWSPAPTPTDGWRPRYLQPSAERFVTFTKDGREVGVFIAYYRNQTFDSKLVSSENVLVTSNDKRWMQLTAGERQLRGSGLPPEVLVAELTDRVAQRLRVWQWYWVDGQWTNSPARAKAMTALAQLIGRGDDSAAMVLVTPQLGRPTRPRRPMPVLELSPAGCAGHRGSALQATRSAR